MTKNKKNSLSLVGVLALFVALTTNVHAQTTTQPATTPAPTTRTAPAINPQDLLRMMFGPQVQVVEAPSAKAYENLFHSVWQGVAARYYNPDALVAKDWGKWEHAYDGKLLTEDDLDQALKTMLNSLGDHWTKYVSPQDMEQSEKRKQTGIVSLGIHTRVDADSNIVISFLDFGSPAYNSPLRVGDVLKAVDGKPLTGKTAEAADELMSGEVGKDMTINYVPASGETRDAANVKLVFAKNFEGKSEAVVLPGKVLYLRLPEFEKAAYASFEKAMNTLKNKPGFEESFDYIVLDLRGNPGGDVTLALHMVETFMSSGIAYNENERNGRVYSQSTKRVSPFLPFLGKNADSTSICQTPLLQKKPMAILVNGSSASSAEIVTASLGGNHRAVVIGKQTWGKAVAWTPMELPNGGALFMTIAGFTGPNGEAWHGKGLKPDLEVDQPRNASVDVQLLKAIEVLSKGR